MKILILLVAVCGFSWGSFAAEDGQLSNTYEKGETAAGLCGGGNCDPNATNIERSVDLKKINARVTAILAGTPSDLTPTLSNDNK